MPATWTAPRTYTTGELITKTILDTHVRDNLLWLKTPTESGNITFASDFTTTATTYVDVTGLTTTMTTNGGGVDVYLRLTMMSNTAGAENWMQLVVDGTSYAVLGSWCSSLVSKMGSYQFFHHVTGLSAGSHTFKIQVKGWAGAGTITIRGTTGALGDPNFYVIERGT